MLLAALGATVIGFVLLIVALITAKMWLAIACVVVSVIGVLLLLGDVLTYRRGGAAEGAGRRKPWSPGPEDDGAAPAAKPAARAGDGAEPDGDDAGETGTVGHEEFGHHEGDPALIADMQRAEIADWTHESPADTDDDDERELYRTGDAAEPAEGETEHLERDPDDTDVWYRRTGPAPLSGTPLYDPDLTDHIRVIKDDDPDPRDEKN